MGLLDDELGAAFGMFPQMKPRRRLQDREASANVPLDVTRGRFAGLAGLLPDTLNFMGRSPMPAEMFGDTQYEPAQQLPYGSEYYLQNLPLKPTSRIGEVAGQAGAFVPLNPMPAARAVAAGARALGPTAVGMGERYLQRQGLMPQLDVYHGSPHKFDRFDASKIGTGEGNQSYGHGLYFAENPEVAETYQKMVNTGSISKQAKKFVRENIIAGADNDAILKAATSSKNQATRWDLEDVKRGIPASRNDYVNAMDEVQEFLTKNPISQNDGSFYKVDLPDKQIAKMLDFDKQLSEQSAEVKNILLPYQKEIGGSFGTGEQTLKAIAFERRMKGLDDSPAAVAQQLRDMGIPGIKYLDATSRGAGTGTRNFVTFPGEEQSMTILERNGQPMVARTQQQDAAPDLLQYQQMLDDEERRKSAGLLFR